MKVIIISLNFGVRAIISSGIWESKVSVLETLNASSLHIHVGTWMRAYFFFFFLLQALSNFLVLGDALGVNGAD